MTFIETLQYYSNYYWSSTWMEVTVGIISYFVILEITRRLNPRRMLHSLDVFISIFYAICVAVVFPVVVLFGIAAIPGYIFMGKPGQKLTEGINMVLSKIFDKTT